MNHVNEEGFNLSGNKEETCIEMWALKTSFEGDQEDNTSPSSCAEHDQLETGNMDMTDNNECIRTPEDEEYQVVDLELIHRAQRLLYLSHFSGQFTEISWQFSLVIFLSACTHYRSLFLISTYGICVNITMVIFGSGVGKMIDYLPRLRVARLLIVSENLSVIVASFCCYLLLSLPLNETFHDIPVDPLSIFLLLAIHSMGSVAQLMDRAFLVAVERDWVVVLCKSAGQHNFASYLTSTNVTMKQIDLSCKVLAPSLIGVLVPVLNGNSTEPHNLRGACVVIGLLNVISLFAEYVCTERVYRLIPALVLKGGDTVALENAAPKVESKSERSWDMCACQGLQIFFSQKSFAAGLALSMLYMNGLTFGNGIMSAYLVSQGVRLESVGVLRGVASAIGLLGTFAFKISSARFSLPFTGLWSIWYEFLCLCVSVFSLYIDNVGVSLLLLVGGLCFSRIGLWVFDIAVTQIQQQEIPDKYRGSVGGTQQSLNALFTLFSFGIGILFPDPEDFHVFVGSAATCVGLAALLYYYGLIYRQM